MSRKPIPPEHPELRQRRRALDLTQEQVADALGCTDVAVHYAERGLRRGRVARQMANLLRNPFDSESIFSVSPTREKVGPMIVPILTYIAYSVLKGVIVSLANAGLIETWTPST